jgi:hypothetical protein
LVNNIIVFIERPIDSQLGMQQDIQLFHPGPNETLFEFYETERRNLVTSLQEMVQFHRTRDVINIVPKIILVHHRQREQWFDKYVFCENLTL